MGKNNKGKSDKVITFDDAKRKDYLTGFGKRKKARREFAVRRDTEEQKKQKKDDRLEHRRQNRANKLGVAVDDLEEIDAQISASIEAEEPPLPGADVTHYEAEGMLTTAVVTPLLEDEDEDGLPPRLHNGTTAPSQHASAASSATAGNTQPKKKPLPKKDQKKKSEGAKKNRILSKKQKGANKSKIGIPKSNVCARSGGMKGRTR